jgi:hypothetical protein
MTRLLKKLEVLFYPMLQPSERTLLFGRFPGFARLCFWKEQRVDNDEYEASVEH